MALNAYMKGLAGVAISILKDGEFQTPFQLGCPKVIGFKENEQPYSFKGGNTECEFGATLLNVEVDVTFNNMSLQQQAALIGADFETFGSGDEQEDNLQRQVTDKAPYLRLEGMVDFIGSSYPDGTYNFLGHYGKVVSAPTWSNESDKEAEVTMKIRFVKRPQDKTVYNMLLVRGGRALPTSADNTAPTVSSVSPADNATGVSVSANVTWTLSKGVLFNSNCFKVYRNQSGSLTAVDGVITYDKSTFVVTFNPDSNFVASGVYVTSVKGLIDTAGNPQAVDFTSDFTAA